MRGGDDRPAAQQLPALWLAELQEIARAVAHEVNNMLNAVSVNLEVVRSRADKGAEASKIAPFATGAAEQLEALTPVALALVRLARVSREPTDIAGEAAGLCTLLGPVARVRGGSLSYSGPDEGAVSCVSGATARVVLSSAVRRAAESGLPVACLVEQDAGSVRVALSGTDGGASGVQLQLDLPHEISDAAADAGVGIDRTASALILHFPVSTPDTSSRT